MDNLKKLEGYAKLMMENFTDEQLKKVGYYRDKEDQEVPEFSKEYARKVYDEKANIISLTEHKRKSLIMNNLHESVRKEGGKEFVINDNNAALMKLLYPYFKGTSEALNNKKGLCLYGDTGVGKSTILRAFLSVPYEDIDRTEWESKKPLTTSAIHIVEHYNVMQDQRGNQTSWMEKYLHRDLVIDDFGTEPMQKYATKESEPILGKLIEARQFSSKYKTYYSQNISMDEVLERYGKRIYSRIYGRCNVLDMSDFGMVKDIRVEGV